MVATDEAPQCGAPDEATDATDEAPQCGAPDEAPRPEVAKRPYAPPRLRKRELNKSWDGGGR